jgi:stage II sporulation protein AA (anti-sigma F factor antagonist)
VNVTTKRAGRRFHVFLEGELDDHAAAALRPRLDDILDGESMESVIFDLGRLTFTDSTGIGFFIGRYKKLKNRGIPVYLKNTGPHIEKIFKMTGLFEIMPKIEEA